VIQITGTHYSYVVTHILLSIRIQKLYKATEINESLSTHEIKKQHPTEVNFYLIRNKQYAYFSA